MDISKLKAGDRFIVVSGDVKMVREIVNFEDDYAVVKIIFHNMSHSAINTIENCRTNFIYYFPYNKLTLKFFDFPETVYSAA